MPGEPADLPEVELDPVEVRRQVDRLQHDLAALPLSHLAIPPLVASPGCDL